MSDLSTHGKQPPTIIFCDGSCQPNPGDMEIGVYCDDPPIRLHMALGHGTSNRAEFFAAIAALKEAKKLKLSGIELRCDSKLVIDSVTGRSNPMRRGRMTYVQQIRQLLAEVKGRLEWIPRSANPADAMSRQHLQQAHDFDSPIDRINKLSHEQLRFKDFVNLKSGWDEFSSLAFSALAERISAHDLESLMAQTPDEQHLAKVIRWMLRGLKKSKALRKVATDADVARNVRHPS